MIYERHTQNNENSSFEAKEKFNKETKNHDFNLDLTMEYPNMNSYICVTNASISASF